MLTCWAALPEQETYAYAKTLLDVATASADGRPRALLVGGGIANFTDVAATFQGHHPGARQLAPLSLLLMRHAQPCSYVTTTSRHQKRAMSGSVSWSVVCAH